MFFMPFISHYFNLLTKEKILCFINWAPHKLVLFHSRHFASYFNLNLFFIANYPANPAIFLPLRLKKKLPKFKSVLFPEDHRCYFIPNLLKLPQWSNRLDPIIWLLF
jgi:hypothetical protein